MNDIEEKNKNILVPVIADDENIPENKIIKMAKEMGSKIHLAGFVSCKKQQVENLFRQTLKMTQKINELTQKIKLKGCQVTSKIYMNSFRAKANEVVQKQNIGIITSSKDSVNQINNPDKDTIHLLMNKSENGSIHQDILFLHPVDKKHSQIVGLISKLFGKNLYMVERVSKEAVRSLTEYFDKPLDPKLRKHYNSKEIRKWLAEHEPGLIVMKKDHVKKNNHERKIFKNVDTPVLLF